MQKLAINFQSIWFNLIEIDLIAQPGECSMNNNSAQMGCMHGILPAICRNLSASG